MRLWHGQVRQQVAIGMPRNDVVRVLLGRLLPTSVRGEEQHVFRGNDGNNEVAQPLSVGSSRSRDGLALTEDPLVLRLPLAGDGHVERADRAARDEGRGRGRRDAFGWRRLPGARRLPLVSVVAAAAD